MNRILNPFDEGIGVELACPIPWCRARINQYCVDRAGEEVERGHWARRVPMRIGRRFLAWVRRRRERSRNVVAYRRETTFGALPPIDAGKMRFAPVTGVKTPTYFGGGFSFDCPNCGAPITTGEDNHTGKSIAFGYGLTVKLTGVLCSSPDCRRSYTVEMHEQAIRIEGPITPATSITITPEPNPPAEAYREWITYGRSVEPTDFGSGEDTPAEPEKG